MDEKEDLNGEELTEWTCSYCPSVATTIRQGRAVCYHHATQLSVKTGWLSEFSFNRERGNIFPVRTCPLFPTHRLGIPEGKRVAWSRLECTFPSDSGVSARSRSSKSPKCSGGFHGSSGGIENDSMRVCLCV